MLVLAGLGISDEKGITLEGLEEARSSDLVFLELYTSIWHGSIENLERIVGKEIQILKRKDLEEEVHKILELASHKKIMIFVPGDPLVATTHSSIILECMKSGIEFKVIHNSSIVSTICETGLHIYKFGQIVTIPLRERIIEANSVINAIVENKRRGLHTLCLLDIDAESNKYVEVKEAVRFLLENRVIDEDEKLVVGCCLGSARKKILWKKAREVLLLDLPLPAVIVIPGRLHFSEKEMLEKL